MVARRGWRPVYDEDKGFLFQQAGKPASVIGVSSIRAELGSYFDLPFRTYITVFWGFDESGELMEVWVWKT